MAAAASSAPAAEAPTAAESSIPRRIPICINFCRHLSLCIFPELTAATAITVHNGTEFCWLTQEDVVRFLLSSIRLFSPILSLGAISKSLADQIS